MLPVVIGFLSAIYLFDTDSKKLFTIVSSGIIVAINVISILMGFYVSFISVSAIAVAYLTSRAFLKNQNKAETAYIATILCALFGFLGRILFAMMAKGSFTFDAAFAYYGEFFDFLKQMALDGVESLNLMYTAQGMIPPALDLELYFDILFKSVISFLVIGGFMSVGFGMKIFAKITSKISENDEHILRWRFIPSRSYAYVYIVLAILWMFVPAIDSAFGVSVMNLYNVISAIFIYFGFMVVYSIVRSRMSKLLALFVTFAAILMFSSLAIQVLAIIGVISTFRANFVPPVNFPPNERE